MNYDLSRFKKQEVSFGYTGIKLFAPEEINEAQLGYSVHPNGESLVGNEDGDWQSTWIVIGHTTDLGDPIFVDTCTEHLPVFIAMHGQGCWESQIISHSYQAFLKVMAQFSELSFGREYPTKLEGKPMTQQEYDDFISYVRDTAEIQDPYFWELLVSDEEAGIGPEI